MIRILFTAILALFGAVWVAHAEPVGTVTRLKGHAAAGALALSDGQTVPAGAILRTEALSRLEIKFMDGTVLVLGESAEIVIDDFVYDAAARTGNARLKVSSGAFLVSSGGIGKLPDRPLKVVTPVATISIRGTKFWGGSLDNPLDVLVLEGAIRVDSPVGGVTLDQTLQGTSVTAVGASPNPPAFWAPDRIDRAFKTVSFE